MTPAARLSAAIGILDQWLAGKPVEQALTHWARRARYAGSKDRTALRDIVYGIVRRKGSCAAAGGAETGRALVLGWLHLSGKDPSALFTGEGYAPAPLSETERGVVPPEMDPRRDVQPWHVPHLEARFGSELEPVLEICAQRAPVWLRVNLSRAGRDEVAARLAAEGIVARAHGEVATALEVCGSPRNLRQTRVFGEGLVEFQDLSVQWAIAKIDWPQRGRVLDYCAGGGGKSLAIADRSTAQIFAHDISAKRMADLDARAMRAAQKIVKIASQDLEVNKFDAVVADVPCSGSGTWRRDPEAKWRLTPSDLEALSGVQKDILAQAATHVSAAGRLIYMTCSLFDAENESIVSDFVSKTGGWSLVQSHFFTPLTASDGFYLAEFSHDG